MDCARYQELFEEEKNDTGKYAKNRYHDMSEEEKQKKDRKKHLIRGNSQEEFPKTIRTNNRTNEKNLRNIKSYES